MDSLMVFFVVWMALSSAHVRANQIEAVRTAEAAFTREVGGIPIDVDYGEKVVRKAEELIHHSGRFDVLQFFLLVDRNHAEQKVFLAFYDARTGVQLLGADKTSTGNPSRRGFFETPTGIFENTPANMNYRALGTKNAKGWRGLGAKGSRVWDLGWQRTVRERGQPMDIRLLVHATDPDFGEARLGRVDSKGCIRVSARFNRFFDYYGILDSAYEASDKAKRVLLAKRGPVAFAGRFVVVIDSAH